MLCWTVLDHRARPEMAGLIPAFITDADPRPLREQIDDRYSHGGGWAPMQGHTLNHTTLELTYPGDPPLVAMWYTRVRDEEFMIYGHGFCVIRHGYNFEVARLD